jgi:hypothetical protein
VATQKKGRSLGVVARSVSRGAPVDLSIIESLGLAVVGGLIHAVIKNPKSAKSQKLKHWLTDTKVLVDEAVEALNE